jgi:hypothetical protein
MYKRLITNGKEMYYSLGCHSIPSQRKSTTAREKKPSLIKKPNPIDRWQDTRPPT